MNYPVPMAFWTKLFVLQGEEIPGGPSLHGSLHATTFVPFRRQWIACSFLFSLALVALMMGCKRRDENRAAQEAPPAQPAIVAVNTNGGVLHLQGNTSFALAAAALQQATKTLEVTGSVAPDVSREVPVLSIANGRVVALHAGLGDVVHRGQLIMEVQSPDVSTAFATYLKTVADEHLAQIVLNRDQLLFDKGAIAKSQLEIAQNGEDDAQAALKASLEQLHILGVDRDHPGDTVKVFAPASGVIIAQNTTASGAAGITFAGANGSFTIADLSHVWVLCDVYENDLAQVHLGQSVQIRLNAYPDKVRTGIISDIGAVLDPAIRTAKVRIQVQNPDSLLRIGMFAAATFLEARAESVVTVPGTAILHLHDSEFVFEPAGSQEDFRQVQVKAGKTLSGNMVEILSGVAPGQQVVANALELQNTAAQ